MGITRSRGPDGGVKKKHGKKMGITRPRPDGGVIIMKKRGITRPRPDDGVIRIFVTYRTSFV